MAVWKGLLWYQSENGELDDVGLNMFESQKEGTGRGIDSSLVTKESTFCSLARHKAGEMLEREVTPWLSQFTLL